jgi:hypothetical protein
MSRINLENPKTQRTTQGQYPALILELAKAPAPADPLAAYDTGAAHRIETN